MTLAESNALVSVMLDAERIGISRGTSGNASTRVGTGFVITPASVSFASMEPGDLVSVDESGLAIGPHAPSSDWLLHQRIYQHRPDVKAIVHLHSPSATALSALRVDIPPFHHLVATAGGPNIRCSLYAKAGTAEAADAAIVALAERTACLLANHGMLACGTSVREAYDLAIEVESLSQQFLLATAAGKPVLLARDEFLSQPAARIEAG